MTAEKAGKAKGAEERAGNPAETEPVAEQPASGFPIVGIGASAGGLAAFEAFFSGLPADTDPGMAFVLVQHLAPDHKSILTDLVRHYTRMEVFEVEDNMVVRPNCVYIIPPNHDMAFLDGALHLLQPAAPRGQRLPIDYFFRSLAQDQREQSVCIVLSGTGSDGTLGVRAVKGAGGMAMAQALGTAEFGGMPSSAIDTGLVDYELPPAQMPAQLIAYAARAYGKRPLTPPLRQAKAECAMKKVFILLRARTGHDFSQYKPSTIQRRIDRRIAVHKIDNIEQYVKFLTTSPSEVEALFRDLLIGVTSFFRDPEAFKALEEQVIPRLFAGRSAELPIRVWVPGCATGEEAYSIAILLAERQLLLKQNRTVQIFATDIDGAAIAKARAGHYPAGIAADLSAARLARFFTAEPGRDGYRIHRGIRDTLVFSEHDLIKDPPFSKLDLLSCRNLLIYLNGELQKRLMPMFHYALNPGGTLLLGSSETVGDAGPLFVSTDLKAKLYQRQDGAQAGRRGAPKRYIPAVTAVNAAVQRESAKTPFHVKWSARELTEHALLAKTVPAAALVTGEGDILYLHGRTGMYLELSPGEVGAINILNIAREGLRRDLSMALHQSAGTHETVSCPGLRVKTNGDFTVVNLTVSPVHEGVGAPADQPLYLVVLEEAPPCDPELARRTVLQALAPGDGAGKDADARIAALTQQLRAREEQLQSAHEQMDSSTEELKSANEEMQSVNEELQSTNEELETAKEELQSVNEELATVNCELQTRVTDLTRVNNDMTNLLAGTGIATVFVDHQLRIMRFTPSATAIINLIPGDVGRPVGHIVSNLTGDGDLVQDVRAVLDTLGTKDRDVQTADGRWYRLHMQPYRTIDNLIEGAVMTFVENTEAKQAQEALRKSEDLFKTLFFEAPLGIAQIDSLTGCFCQVNPALARIAGRTVEELRRTDWMSVTHPEDMQAGLDQMARFNAGETDGFQMNKRYLLPGGAVVWVGMTIARMKVEDAAHPRHLCMIEDISARKLAEEGLRKANNLLRLAVVVRDAHDAVTVQDLEGRILAWNPGAVRMYGWTEDEALAMSVGDRIPAQLRKDAMAKMRQLSQSRILEPYHTQRLAKDGTVLEVCITATALLNDAGNIYAVATTERIVQP